MSLNNLISELCYSIALGQKLDVIMPLVKKYNGDDWKQYVNFCTKKYTRNLVYQNDLFDVYIICWNNKQESPIHDHADNGCVMKILEGRLIQELFDHNIKSTIKMPIFRNQVTYIDNDIGYHKIINTNTQTVSLHIYSPSSHQTKIFNASNTPTV
jgi:predicted metal-dependent enzyme (double-stranded beta helix superfamily)